MKRHRTDLLSMFSGLVFLGLGGVFVTGRVDAIDLEAQWLWPMPLILGGLFIFLAAFRSEPEAVGEAAAVEPASGAETMVTEPAAEAPAIADEVHEGIDEEVSGAPEAGSEEVEPAESESEDEAAP